MMKDKFDEAFIREQVRQILEEESLLSEQGWAAPKGRQSSKGTTIGKGPATAYSDYWKADRRKTGPQSKWDSYVPSKELFYKAFVGPFVDVFKVAKAALKQTMADVITTLQMVTTFDLEKKKELQAKFQQNRQKYGGELQAAMKNIDESLATNDAKMIGFMLAPAPALAYAATQAVGDVADPITSELGEKLGGFAGAFGLSGAQQKKAARRAGLAQGKDRGLIRGLGHDLKVLFFGPEMGAGMPESFDYMDQLALALNEGEEDEEGEDAAEPIDTIDAVNAYIEESGLQAKFDEIAEAILAEKKEEIEFVLTELEEKLAVLSELGQARTIAEIQPLLPKLQKFEIDISQSIVAVEDAVREQVEMIKAGGPEADAIKKELLGTEDAQTAKLSDESTTQDWAPMIETGVIAGQLTDAVQQAKAGAAEGLMDYITEGMSPAELEALSKASPAGAQFAELISGFEGQIQQILGADA